MGQNKVGRWEIGKQIVGRWEIGGKIVGRWEIETPVSPPPPLCGGSYLIVSFAYMKYRADHT